MEKKFRVGVVGYGWVASAHIPSINSLPNAEVTAVCSSRDLDPAAVSAEHGGNIKVYKDLDSMLADPDIDVIDICSYPNQHADQVIKVAKAGKHLIIEKPLALNWKDLKRMKAAIDKAGIKVCVCFECRFSSQFLSTKAVLDKGLLGHLHYGEVDYYHGIGPWYGQFRWNTTKEAGGSSLLSAGCHAMDALILCMGSEVESVTSVSTGSKNKTFKKYEYDTTSVTILNFKNGAVGKCASVIDCLQPYYFHTHLVGSEGSLLDDKFHSTKLGTNKAAWSKLSMTMLDSGDVSDHPYSTQFESFFTALTKGKDMPLTSFNDAFKSHQAIFAADISAQKGRPVKISDLK
ncbi:Gfo/Idh/MocA family oxidoreductase [Verrucomicrobia bacterium]|nr:Gfo/Idh/MocA family oxidoreductase [Verrucomicrobiota bacterium]